MKPSVLTDKQQRLLHYVQRVADKAHAVSVTSIPHNGAGSVRILAERGYLRVKVTITHRGRKHLRDCAIIHPEVAP